MRAEKSCNNYFDGTISIKKQSKNYFGLFFVFTYYFYFVNTIVNCLKEWYFEYDNNQNLNILDEVNKGVYYGN